MENMVYTPQMLAKWFNVTNLKPYESDLKTPVSVKGRKSYIDARVVAVRISENKAYGYAVGLTLFVDGHYRKLSWKMLSDDEKLRIQKELGL